MLMSSKGKWLDVNCDMKKYVMCEKCLSCQKEVTGQF